ncbi:hypothetical protein AJ79_02955 [Helicocarpus griseus UAMH5409]|uniref:FAD/NAD(P)-binding domain-containing protein n=1 Tax=Helicocarpus griseus UAMH5409 TaxID=1447875 RepID=A0A2B7Y015_9EURO|nr:hypothetical protein AJ79_02955 [Helicocarpus griseus UAMH5409]
MEKNNKLYNDVVIIGAGLSGINMACQLQRKLGVTDYVIYDRASALGGAWTANQYPGCGVDIPGVLYSLSWFPNPNFTSIFPRQDEILAYIQKIANSYNVSQHTSLRTEWRGAKWIEKISRWHVYLEDIATGQQYIHEAKILISAVGGYTNPKYPSLQGMESFQGPIVHTARWDKSYDFRGLDVVVIGNGCSASQVVPAVLDGVRSLTQIIRSPQYYIPTVNLRITRAWQACFQMIPFLLMLIRWVVFWFLETSLFQFYDDQTGKKMRHQSITRSRNYIKENAPERYWPLLTPNYDLGCRRRILDHNYIKSLHDPRLFLTKDSITSVGPNSVRTASGAEYPADAIILATGFQFSQWIGNIIGRNGVSMKQHWDRHGGFEAYKTVAMNEFPNLFYLLGPNGGSGHTSVLYTMECSVDLVIKIAAPVLKRKASSVEVREEPETKWCNAVQEALHKTVLTSDCSNLCALLGRDKVSKYVSLVL